MPALGDAAEIYELLTLGVLGHSVAISFSVNDEVNWKVV